MIGSSSPEDGVRERDDAVVLEAVRRVGTALQDKPEINSESTDTFSAKLTNTCAKGGDA